MFHRCLLTVLLLTIALTAEAQELILVPNVYISARDFKYVANGRVEGNIQSVGLGLTGIYENIYLDISAEMNPSPSRESESTDSLLNTQEVDFDRTDTALTLGYAINSSISTFAGYKYGKTTITALLPSTFAGAEISLESKGFFVGAGGGWSAGDWGFLSFSAAFAWMDANYKDLAVGKDTGSAAGTSLGIKWRAPLTERLNYDISLVRHDYNYEDLNRFGSDINEEILSLRLGLSYRF